MQAKLIKAGILSGIILLFTSCTDNDNGLEGGEVSGIITNVNDINADFNIPATYTFERDGKSTVSFGGQTTRLEMNKEILGYFSVNSGKTAEEVEAAFNHSAGNQDFSTTELNDSGKNVKKKIAASKDLFENDVISGDAIRAVFSGYISKHFEEVVENKDNIATPGMAGVIGTRYVNAKGLEYKQAFSKGSIGALILDQVLNNYLGDANISNQGDIADNNAGTLEKDENHTKYEHHFDEAYGYVYGLLGEEAYSPVTKGADDFLFEYITLVDADSDFSGIQDQIFKAFKLGRAALVAQDYDVLNDAVKVLQYQISKVVAVRGIYYLQAGKRDFIAQNNESAFHALSEAYGFIYSLQFTRNPITGSPYLSASEVDVLIAKLEAGNGFWDLVDGTVLDEVSNIIAAKFDFSVAQAAN